jgi:hypothetical protein
MTASCAESGPYADKSQYEKLLPQMVCFQLGTVRRGIMVVRVRILRSWLLTGDGAQGMGRFWRMPGAGYIFGAPRSENRSEGAR